MTGIVFFGSNESYYKAFNLHAGGACAKPHASRLCTICTINERTQQTHKVLILDTLDK